MDSPDQLTCPGCTKVRLGTLSPSLHLAGEILMLHCFLTVLSCATRRYVSVHSHPLSILRARSSSSTVFSLFSLVQHKHTHTFSLSLSLSLIHTLTRHSPHAPHPPPQRFTHDRSKSRFHCPHCGQVCSTQRRVSTDMSLKMMSVVIPAGVGPGQQFAVMVAGQRLGLTCPRGKRSGDMMQFSYNMPQQQQPPQQPVAPQQQQQPPQQAATKMMSVMVPQGVGPGQQFAVMVGGQRMALTCPAGKRAGDSMQFRVADPGAAAAAAQQPSSPSDIVHPLPSATPSRMRCPQCHTVLALPAGLGPDSHFKCPCGTRLKAPSRPGAAGASSSGGGSGQSAPTRRPQSGGLPSVPPPREQQVHVRCVPPSHAL